MSQEAFQTVSSGQNGISRAIVILQNVYNFATNQSLCDNKLIIFNHSFLDLCDLIVAFYLEDLFLLQMNDF